MSEQTKHAEHEHHIVGPGVYVIILFALLAGTALTVWASFLELGPWNPIIALAIATDKGHARGALLHARKVQHEADQAHRLLRHLHVPCPDLDDPVGLHQPGLGAVVGKQLPVISCQWSVSGVLTN